MSRRSSQAHASSLFAKYALGVLCFHVLSCFESPAAAALPKFVRSDTNGDGQRDISDGVSLLGCLYLGSKCSDCKAAADANGDGNVDIGDAIYILDFQFRGGRAPPPPFPSCGVDPAQEPRLPCLSYPPCDTSAEEEVSLEDNPAPQDPPDSFEEPAGDGELDPVVVAPGVLAALAALPEGTPIWEIQAIPGAEALAAAVLGDLRSPGSPNAVAVNVLAPHDGSGSLLVPTALVGQYSSDPDAPPEEKGFLRGDTNCDGRVNPADAELIDLLFRTGNLDEMCCADAADANDDGEVSISDVVFLLGALASGRPLPPPGVVQCGVDPTPDELPKCQVSSCPGSRTALKLVADPPLLTGLGPHVVRLNVVDVDGNSATATCIVTICEPGTPGCPHTPTVTSEPPPTTTTSCGSVKCRWVSEWTTEPAAVTTTRGSTAVDEWLVHNGIGPYHDMLAQRERGACASAATRITKVATGTVVNEANVLCFDTEGNLCKVECKSEIEIQGVYLSTVEIETAAGSSCGEGRPNKIQALAQDEAQFVVNGNEVFNKAVAITNGTDVETSFEYSFGVEVGASEKDGLSSSINASRGYSETINRNTGKDADAINARSGAKVDVPMTATMTSKGKVLLNASHKTAGYAQTMTGAWGIYWVGNSTCPGAGVYRDYAFFGGAAEKDSIKRFARAFFRTRLGRDAIP